MSVPASGQFFQPMNPPDDIPLGCSLYGDIWKPDDQEDENPVAAEMDEPMENFEL